MGAPDRHLGDARGAGADEGYGTAAGDRSCPGSSEVNSPSLP